MKVSVVKVLNFMSKERVDVDYSKTDILDRPSSGWDSYAACSSGNVLLYSDSDEDKEKIRNSDLVIVACDIERHLLHKLIEFLQTLENTKVLIGYHEGIQAIHHLASPSKHRTPTILLDITKMTAGKNIGGIILNTPNDSSLFFKYLFPDLKSYRLNYCWPVHSEEIECLRTPIENKNGIILGIRSFNNYVNRNPLINIVLGAQLSNELNCKLTVVVNKGEYNMFEEFKCLFNDKSLYNLIRGPLSYRDWLSTLGQHKLCLNFDTAMVQGQTVGDCAMMKTPVVGGNSTIQHVMFNHLCAGTVNIAELHDTCKRILENNKELRNEIQMIEQKLDYISFESTRDKLDKIYMELSNEHSMDR